MRVLFRYRCLFILLFLLSACEKDTDNPSVELLNGNWLTENTSISPGGSLKFKWKVRSGKSDLYSFTLTQDGTDLPRFPVNNIPPDVYLDSTYIEGPIQTGSYVFNFLATDVDGKTGDRSIVVTVE
jgi:hypothetical protein